MGALRAISLVGLLAVLGSRASGASLARARAPLGARSASCMSAAPSVGERCELATDAMSSLGALFEQLEGAAQLASHFSDDVKVASPVWSASSRTEWEAEVANLGKFLIDPSFEVLSVQRDSESGARVEWLASGTWPLPWRPRAVVLGSSTLELEARSSGPAQVVRVTDALHTSLLDVLTSQLMPNWEDVYNLYNSPPAETKPYRVVRKAGSYEVRWLPPGLALQCEVRSDQYPSAKSHKLGSPVLPACAFTGKPLNNRAVWSAVRPIAIELDQSARAEGGPCTYRWILPLPSRLGADEAKLPPLPPTESEAETMAYVRTPARYVAARRSAGMFDSDNAVLAEVDKLLEQLRADGITTAHPAGGDAAGPAFQFRQYNCKLGYNMQGQLAIAQYQGTAELIRRNEILVEVNEPR